MRDGTSTHGNSTEKMNVAFELEPRPYQMEPIR